MASRRRGGTLGDMARSLGLVVAVIGVLALVLPRHHYTEVHVVDYQHDVQVARQDAGYHVLAPTGLGAGWRATSARVSPPDAAPALRLHVGFVTPREQYAALEESGGNDTTFVAEQTDGQRRVGQRNVGGHLWTSYAGNGNRSLVTMVGATRLVVTGSASDAELDQLAAALR